MIRIAVLSDPHLHDVRFGSAAAEARFVRSLSDSLHSTRVFNESEAAFRAALDTVAAEGIRLCIIVGDLTDDGQSANWQAVSDFLADYSRRHSIRFFATPGNHDQWSMTGKPLAKNFVDPAGNVAAFAGQGLPGSDGAQSCPGMRMLGYDEALPYAGEFGYHPHPSDLHWETPFGTTPDMAGRRSRVTSDRGDSALISDMSYLVEPVEGLWLLSIDANVYLPDGDGGFVDCSKDGWNATLRHKPYLLDWMRDVARRARAENKRLVAFSHYPVADIFCGLTAELETLPGSRAGARRMPTSDVAAAIAATGIPLHFSGHWHVDATATAGGLVNVSVPSTVAYPAGWKCLEIDADGTHISDRALPDAPGFDAWFARYAAEADRTGQDRSVLSAADYRQFLDRHFRAIVLQRRLPEDWPPQLQAMAERARLPELVTRLSLPQAARPDIAFADIFVDWYRLREAGGGAAAGVSRERRALYAELAQGCARMDYPEGSDAAILAVFLRTLGLLLKGYDAKRAALDRLKEAYVPC
ncbi:metallophosphoesterase family protein [Martelella soudanensis]|uniref:metallophosphoesterase family protein n=1 Tax=unclassified Martelella TaxID=2629616 RepID=UPI0015DD8745|nr:MULTISPECIES: metallophosphoesterase [unclassified Martelella]